MRWSSARARADDQRNIGLQEHALAALCNLSSHRPTDEQLTHRAAHDDRARTRRVSTTIVHSEMPDDEIRAEILEIRRKNKWDHDEDTLTVAAREAFLVSMRSAGGILCALHAMRTYHKHEAIQQYALTLLGVLGAAELSKRPSEAELKEETMIASLPISDGAFYNLAPPLRLNKTKGSGDGTSPTAGGSPGGSPGTLRRGGAAVLEGNDEAEFDSVAAAAAAEKEKSALPPELAYLATPSGYEKEILGSGVVPLALDALSRGDASPGLRSAGLSMLSTLAHEHTEQKMATERKHAAAVDDAGEREAARARRGALLAHELQQQLEVGVNAEAARASRGSRDSDDAQRTVGDADDLETVGSSASSTLECAVAIGLRDGGYSCEVGVLVTEDARDGEMIAFARSGLGGFFLLSQVREPLQTVFFERNFLRIEQNAVPRELAS